MAEEERSTLRYRILRYTPNLIRDEWVIIGVLLEETESPRRAMRVIEEEHLGRVRRLHPEADLDFLRRLPAEFSARLSGRPSAWRTKSANSATLSNGVQFGRERVAGRRFRNRAQPPVRRAGGADRAGARRVR